jgi:hypothetical protein
MPPIRMWRSTAKQVTLTLTEPCIVIRLLLTTIHKQSDRGA